MAPNGESPAAMTAVAPLLATIIGSFSGGGGEHRRQRVPSCQELRSYVAGDHDDHDKEVELLSHDGGVGVGGDPRDAAAASTARSSAAEVEDAECECCGMSEECTPEYIRGVRGRFAGRWVCGLCAEAVTEEAEKTKQGGGTTAAAAAMEAALKAHMGVCKRFNGFGRTHPVLFQAEAMREILRRRAKLGPRSRSSINPREVREVAAKKAAGGGGTGIARSSSCMPFAVTEDFCDGPASSSSNKN